MFEFQWNSMTLEKEFKQHYYHVQQDKREGSAL